MPGLQIVDYEPNVTIFIYMNIVLDIQVSKTVSLVGNSKSALWLTEVKHHTFSDPKVLLHQQNQ